LNIVFAKTDQEILKYLYNDTSIVSDALYSRYIDDIAISFKDFKNYVNIEQQFVQTNNKLLNAFDTPITTAIESVYQIEIISGYIDELVKCPVVFDDEYNRGRIRTLLLKIKEKILDYVDASSYKNIDAFQQTKYTMI
jgi:hypothetical protein